MKEYPKIYGPYQRHVSGPLRNRLDESAWSSPVLEYLQHNEWIFTEKVDGTNIRVGWDGHRVSFGGRTDNAELPGRLTPVLVETFREELFEQTFGDTPATLYGEGYGHGIQKGKLYRDDCPFVLFDVLVGGFWLQRANVEDVAAKLGIAAVPVVLTGTLHDGIKLVRDGLDSAWGPFPAEGIVGVPSNGLLDRAGKRIAVKIKRKDFAQAGREEDRRSTLERAFVFP